MIFNKEKIILVVIPLLLGIGAASASFIVQEFVFVAMLGNVLIGTLFVVVFEGGKVVIIVLDSVYYHKKIKVPISVKFFVKLLKIGFILIAVLSSITYFSKSMSAPTQESIRNIDNSYKAKIQNIKESYDPEIQSAKIEADKELNNKKRKINPSYPDQVTGIGENFKTKMQIVDALRNERMVNIQTLENDKAKELSQLNNKTVLDDPRHQNSYVKSVLITINANIQEFTNSFQIKYQNVTFYFSIITALMLELIIYIIFFYTTTVYQVAFDLVVEGIHLENEAKKEINSFKNGQKLKKKVLTRNALLAKKSIKKLIKELKKEFKSFYT